MGSVHRLTEVNILPKFTETFIGFKRYGTDMKCKAQTRDIHLDLESALLSYKFCTPSL